MPTLLVATRHSDRPGTGQSGTTTGMSKKRYDPADAQIRPLPSGSDESVWFRGVEFPEWFEVELTHPQWSAAVVMSIRIDPDTGPVLVGLRAGEGSTATYQDVQALVASTQREQLVASSTAYMAGVNAALKVYRALPTALATPPEQVGETLGRLRDLVIQRAYPAARPRQRKLTPQFLREVAEVYSAAKREGRPPTIAVAEHFRVSHRTATRWAGEARKAGELDG